jgi:hypothetical protein
MTHEFVEFIPDQLQEGVIYVSIPYGTVAHKCACGCGNEVITPLSPTDWKLTFDGESITLFPSIGNWNFDCRSHYWITNNDIEWSYQLSESEIREGRTLDKLNKTKYYRENTPTDLRVDRPGRRTRRTQRMWGFTWSRLKQWFSS